MYELDNSVRQDITEGWSQKYKSSINCSHPKGFSQKAHCAGKKKHTESVETEMTCPDCGMCKTHGSLNEIKKGAKDSNGFTKCWPGKHAEGTKKGKNGKPVRNCVPNESQGVAEGSLNEFAQGNGGDDGEAFNPGLAKMAQEHGFTKGVSLADGASLATAFKITEWDQQFGGLYKQHFVQGFKKGRMNKINHNNKQYNLNLKLMKDGSIIHGEQGVVEMRDRRDSYQRDYDSSIAGMDGSSHREFKRQEMEHELGHETNNYAVSINGKTWKVFGSRQEANRVSNAMERKYPDKKIGVHATGAEISESATAGATSAANVGVGAIYKNKPVSQPKNKNGTAKNALDMKGANLLGGGSIKR